MVKPPGRRGVGCRAYSLGTANLKGSSRSENAVRSLAPGFISEAWPRARSRSLTPLRSTESDGVYSTWTQVPPEAFSSLRSGWKALTPGRQGAPTTRRRRQAELSLLREGTGGPRASAECGLLWKRELSWEAEPHMPRPVLPRLCCRGSSPHAHAPWRADSRGPGLPMCRISQPWFLAVVF